MEHENDTMILPVLLGVILIVTGILAMIGALRDKGTELYLSESGMVTESITFAPEVVMAEGPDRTAERNKEAADRAATEIRPAVPFLESYMEAVSEPEVAGKMMVCAGIAAVLLGAGLMISGKKERAHYSD